MINISGKFFSDSFVFLALAGFSLSVMECCWKGVSFYQRAEVHHKINSGIIGYNLNDSFS